MTSVLRRLPRPVKAVGTRALYLRSWGKLHQLATRPARTWGFLLRNREVGNFTYALANEAELPAFLAKILHRDTDVLRGYLEELASDRELHGWLTAALRRSDVSQRALVGRRAGWYVALRALRPQVVLETGTDVGMGSAVIARALERNAQDGGPRGHLWTFDLDAEAGWALPASLRPWVTKVAGDLKRTLPATLPKLPGAIDVFLHDSDHSYEHEAFEFAIAATRLSPGGVLLTDNGHVTTALADFSAKSGRRYAFWRERPLDHPYPGAGLGVSVAG